VAGITVVVSAGNFGAGPRTGPGGEFGTVTKPGDDPFVITAGAVDDLETPKVGDACPTSPRGDRPRTDSTSPTSSLPAPG
jgi:serine protease AprX